MLLNLLKDFDTRGYGRTSRGKADSLPCDTRRVKVHRVRTFRPSITDKSFCNARSHKEATSVSSRRGETLRFARKMLKIELTLRMTFADYVMIVLENTLIIKSYGRFFNAVDNVAKSFIWTVSRPLGNCSKVAPLGSVLQDGLRTIENLGQIVAAFRQS